jgi:ribosomal-protein-alanine N-acetyltransferase
LAYEFLPEHWGHGYAEEACRAVLRWGLESLRVDRIIAVTQSANIRSRHLLEKLGMTLIGNCEEWGEPQSVYRITNPAALERS